MQSGAGGEWNLRDVRLKTETIRYNGKDYVLCCNMNVLAELQEYYAGDFSNALRDPNSVRVCSRLLAAMMNDYADSMGWDERVTEKQAARAVSAGFLFKLQEMLTGALDNDGASAALPEAAAEEDEVQRPFPQTEEARSPEVLTSPGI